MAEPFTRDSLTAALKELGDMAHGAGKVIDIAIYGGSCLILASNFRASTADVDAVAASDQVFIHEAAAVIAGHRGWSPDWLNDGVRAYLSPQAELPEGHAMLIAYPSEAEPGVRIFVPTAEYILAMKLMSMRVDASSGQKDLDDILNLFEVVGITRKEEVVGFAARFYPEAKISGRMALALDQLWQAHERRQQAGDHDAPEYLGRSRPAR